MTDLKKYDEKHVQITDVFGETHTGVADYFGADYCLHEFGRNEDSVIVNDFLLSGSEIASIEEIEVHGTAELRTERLILRRYRPEDADALYQDLGTDPDIARYSGWNPYAIPETARETVLRFIDSYRDEHFYGWAIDSEDVLYGTIGAYDYSDGEIEVGFSIVKACRGQGYATEALEEVLHYLTGNEGISRVTAWCAAENAASRKVMEKAGMRFVRSEKNGLTVGENTYDKLIFEYRNTRD